MSERQPSALVEARKLVRTFASAPDARRRAQAVISELRHARGWSVPAQRQIDTVDGWLQTLPSMPALEPRLRELLATLEKSFLRSGASTGP
jgi:hypothetical protein